MSSSGPWHLKDCKHEYSVLHSNTAICANCLYSSGLPVGWFKRTDGYMHLCNEISQFRQLFREDVEMLLKGEYGDY